MTETEDVSAFGSWNQTDERCARIPLASFTTLKSESEPHFPFASLYSYIWVCVCWLPKSLEWFRGRKDRQILWPKEREGSWCVLIRPFQCSNTHSPKFSFLMRSQFVLSPALLIELCFREMKIGCLCLTGGCVLARCTVLHSHHTRVSHLWRVITILILQVRRWRRYIVAIGSVLYIKASQFWGAWVPRSVKPLTLRSGSHSFELERPPPPEVPRWVWSLF